jgi:hypothetical protein
MEYRWSHLSQSYLDFLDSDLGFVLCDWSSQFGGLVSVSYVSRVVDTQS